MSENGYESNGSAQDNYYWKKNDKDTMEDWRERSNWEEKLKKESASDCEEEAKEPLRVGDVVKFRDREGSIMFKEYNKWTVAQVLETHKPPGYCGYMLASLSGGKWLEEDDFVARIGVYSKRNLTITPHDGIAKETKCFRLKTDTLLQDATEDERVQQMRAVVQELRDI